MRCAKCHSTAVRERPERTAQAYRRFRCLECAKQFNERSTGLLNRAQYRETLVLSWCSGDFATNAACVIGP
jgi:putative transposase